MFRGKHQVLSDDGFFPNGKIHSIHVHEFGYLEQWETVEKRSHFTHIPHLRVSAVAQLERTTSISSLPLSPLLLWEKEWQSCPMISGQPP